MTEATIHSPWLLNCGSRTRPALKQSSPGHRSFGDQLNVRTSVVQVILVLEVILWKN